MTSLRAGIAVAFVFGLFVVSEFTASASRLAQRPSPCSNSDVAVSFGVVRGSQGAGQTSYALRVKNVSSASCRTGGLPSFILIGKKGVQLPTRITAACSNCNAPVLVLKPGISAWSEGRFSPDVPGLGETSTGPCEPTAHAVRVTLPGTTGSSEGPVRPPTPVCSRGWIHLSFLGATKPTA